MVEVIWGPNEVYLGVLGAGGREARSAQVMLSVDETERLAAKLSWLVAEMRKRPPC